MNLLTLQRALRSHLVHGADEISGQIRGNPIPRLAVYHSAYRARLLACLRDTFETVWAWLGDARFDAAARYHIDTHPPRSWTLNDYGDEFDLTLRALYPKDPEVPELAWLDWALRRAFDGPNATSLTADALDGVDWDNAVLHLLPTLRMSSISTNCAAIWTAISDGHAPPAASRLDTPSAVRVWRKGLSPHFRTMDSIEQQALVMAIDGASFSSICGALAAGKGHAEAIEIAGALLVCWLQDGLLTAIHAREVAAVSVCQRAPVEVR